MFWGQNFSASEKIRHQNLGDLVIEGRRRALSRRSHPAGARIVAVDATTGTLAPGMGEVLTGAPAPWAKALGS
jgi:hypothetical protein